MINKNTKETSEEKFSWKKEVREWIESILIALVLAMFVRSYFFQPFKIPSGSMRTTLIEGDRLFVNKLRYGPRTAPEVRPFLPFVDQWIETTSLTKWRIPGFGQMKRGDVIVFKFPLDKNKDFIKRLIAKGGESVEIQNGDIYINEKMVTEPRIKKNYYYNRGEYGKYGTKITVPEGYLFVLGDNSGSSHDSRYWGFVPEHDVLGRAELLFWPLNRWRWIE